MYTYKSFDGKDHKNGISNHCKVTEEHGQITCQPTWKTDKLLLYLCNLHNNANPCVEISGTLNSF